MSPRRNSPVNEPVLKASRIFADLSDLELNVVTAFLEPRLVKNGETIFTEGSAGEEMFVFVSGKIDAWVKQADGSQRRMFELKPGDFFGEMSIIAGESRSATLIAQEDSELFALHGLDFFRIIYEYPVIGVKMLNTIRKVQNIWLGQTSKYFGDIMRWGETARHRAISDELTGLYNRRFLEESAADRFKQGFVGLRTVTLIMMDLDKIHEINETYGTKAGDMVFITAADVLRSTTREGDICARLAGDEFSILLPDTSVEEACVIAEKIRKTIASQKTRVPKTPGGEEQVSLSVHTSIGIASAPVHGNTWEMISEAADKALSRSKELGRNRVEVAVIGLKKKAASYKA